MLIMKSLTEFLISFFFIQIFLVINFIALLYSALLHFNFVVALERELKNGG